MKVAAWIGLVVLVLAAAPAAKAGDFDGSKPLLCAPVEVIDCVPGVPCFADTPREMGAPAFLRIDFKRKTVTGPHGEAQIAALEKSDTQLLLQGVEIGHAFALALDRESGRMTATLNDATARSSSSAPARRTESERSPGRKLYQSLAPPAGPSRRRDPR